MFSTMRVQRKTLSGSELIEEQVVYPDDRIVYYASFQTELELKIIPAFAVAGMVVVVVGVVVVGGWLGDNMQENMHKNVLVSQEQLS